MTYIQLKILKNKKQFQKKFWIKNVRKCSTWNIFD